MASGGAAESQCDLPRNVVKRIVKEKLSSTPGAKPDLQINKEALLAFGESAKVFISFITATANDVCKERKRATINADDVFQALEDLEFGDLLPALRDSYEVYKQSSKEKREKKAEVTRKRKSEAQDAGDAAGAAAAAGDEAAEPADTAAASDKSGAEQTGAAAAAQQAAAADADMADAAGTDGADADMADASEGSQGQEEEDS